MNILPTRSTYRGYEITNSGVVVRIFLNGELLHYGAMKDEEAYSWIDNHEYLETTKD